ncbi:MAG: GAF domain-containing protein, partial [Actinomycetia bacterium]|nr:GAF domain-containing protein [Actinomycetes bacterium]
HLRNARDLYSRWGAGSRVEDLEATYPEIRAGNDQDRAATGGDSPAVRLDAMTLVKATRAISEELHVDSLFQTMLDIMVESAGAQSGYLFQEQDGQLALRARSGADIGPDAAQEPVPEQILNYVRRTGERVVLSDASQDPRFMADPLVASRRVKSLLCMPMQRQDEIAGFLLLENSQLVGVFTKGRLDILDILAAQAAVSLENAQLEERGRLIAELEAKNVELKRFNYTVSHDLKNPLITIKGFLGMARRAAASGNLDRLELDLGRIDAAADQMRQLLEELLALSRLGRTVEQQQEVALDEIVRAAVELVDGRITERQAEVEVATG